jgi:hypothetical protein
MCAQFLCSLLAGVRVPLYSDDKPVSVPVFRFETRRGPSTIGCLALLFRCTGNHRQNYQVLGWHFWLQVRGDRARHYNPWSNRSNESCVARRVEDAADSGLLAVRIELFMIRVIRCSTVVSKADISLLMFRIRRRSTPTDSKVNAGSRHGSRCRSSSSNPLVRAGELQTAEGVTLRRWNRMQKY